MPQEARKHRLRRCEKCGTSFVDRNEQARFCTECQNAHDLPEEHVLGGERVVAVGAVEEISCESDTWSSSSEISIAELNQLSATQVEPVEPPKPVEQPPKTTWKSAPFPVHYVGSKSKGSLPAIKQVVDPRSGRQENSQPASAVMPRPEWDDPQPETHHGRTFLWLLLVAALLGLAALFYFYPNWHVEVRRRWAADGQVPSPVVASIPAVLPAV